MTINPHTMTTGDVARVLGISDDRVRQLDDELAPIRIVGTNRRRYDPKRVAALARRRARSVRGSR